MMRLAKLTGLLVAAFAIVLAAVHMGGAIIQPINPAQAILSVSACTQPCWHGLSPGVTTLDEADAMLNSDTQNVQAVVDIQPGLFERPRHVCWTLSVDPGWTGCALRHDGAPGVINEIYLTAPHNQGFSLGDTLVLLGQPAASKLCTRLGFMSATLYFPNNIEVDAFEDHLAADGRYDPHMRIFQVVYHYPSDEPPYPFDTLQWRGFIYVRDLPVC